MGTASLAMGLDGHRDIIPGAEAGMGMDTASLALGWHGPRHSIPGTGVE